MLKKLLLNCFIALLLVLFAKDLFAYDNLMANGPATLSSGLPLISVLTSPNRFFTA